MMYKVTLHKESCGWLELVAQTKQEVQQLVAFGLRSGIDVRVDQVKDDAEQDH